MSHYLNTQGRALIANGYRIVPIEPGTKSPNLPGWSTLDATAADVDRWTENGKAAWGVGILGAETPGIDLDITDATVLEQMLAWCAANVGPAPQRIGRAPRTLLVCRADAPFRKFKSPEFLDSEGRKHAVEIIADGAQFVAHAIHPDTRRPYEWPGRDLTDIPVDLLPTLTEAKARELVAYFVSIIPADWTRVKKSGDDGPADGHVSNPVKSAALAKVESAINALPNEDLDYDSWIRTGMALRNAVGEHESEGRELFHEFSTRSAKYNPEATDKAWDSFKDVKHIGAGTLFREAQAAGWSPPIVAAADEFGILEIDVNETSEKPTSPVKHRIVRASTFAPLDTPERQFLVPDLVPHKNVTTINGDGATGKSLLAMQLALAAATNTKWLGMDVQAGPALYFSAEDDEDETHIRLKDICRGERIDISAVDDLHIALMAGQDALLAVEHIQGASMRKTALFASLRGWMAEIRPVLLVLDNLADIFGGSENVKALARQFVGMLRGLAIEFDCSVVLLSHPSLTGMATGTGSSGNVAWNNSVRSRLYLKRDKNKDGVEIDPNRRTLEVMKANYAASGLTIEMRWERGRFITNDIPELDGVEGLDPAETKIARAERVFKDIVAAYNLECRYMSPSHGANYAPAIFEKHPKAAGVNKTYLEAAMNNLFARGEIAVETVGPPSRQRQRIVFARVIE